MAKFIELTFWAGEKASINTDKIIIVSDDAGGGSSLLIVAGGYSTCKRCRESHEEIKAMLGGQQ